MVCAWATNLGIAVPKVALVRAPDVELRLIVVQPSLPAIVQFEPMNPFVQIQEQTLSVAVTIPPLAQVVFD